MVRVILAVMIDQLDVTKEEAVKSIILKYTTQSDPTQNVNVLFNCAGYVCHVGHLHQILISLSPPSLSLPFSLSLSPNSWVHHGRVDNTSTADWDMSFTLNVRSMFFLSKYIIQQVN